MIVEAVGGTQRAGAAETAETERKVEEDEGQCSLFRVRLADRD